MAAPSGFDTLPAGMAPFKVKGEEGRFLAVTIDGKTVAMREEAVRERMQARENLLIATHAEYDHANAARAMGGLGGQAITAGVSVANGALLGMGVPFTAAALGLINPELSHNFTKAIEQGREMHPGTSLLGEVGGGFTKLPGAIVSEIVGTGKGIVGNIAGAKAARAMEEAARYKIAAEEAQGLLGGAARAGEAKALEGGLGAQRARAVMQGEGAGLPEAIGKMRGAAPEALPTTIKPSYTQAELRNQRQLVTEALGRNPPKGERAALEKTLQQLDEQVPTGAKLRTEPVGGRRMEPSERVPAPETVEGLTEQAQGARRVMAETPETAATQKMAPAVERMEQRIEAMKRSAGDAALMEREGAEGVIANRERRLEAIKGLGGADPKMVSALEEELAALKQQHAPAPKAAAAAAEDLGATRSVGAPEVFAEEQMAKRAATEEQLDPLRQAVRRQSLAYEAREAATGRLAEKEAAEATFDKKMADVLGEGPKGWTRYDKYGNAIRPTWAEGVEETGALATARSGRALKGVRQATEATKALAEAKGAGEVAEAAGEGIPGWNRYDKYGNRITPDWAERTFGTVGGEAAAAEEAVPNLKGWERQDKYGNVISPTWAEGVADESLGKLGGGTLRGEPPVPKPVGPTAEPLDKTLAGVAPPGAEGRAVTPPLTPEAAAQEAAMTPVEPLPLESPTAPTAGQAAFGEGILPKKPVLREGELNEALADVYRKHPQALPEQLSAGMTQEQLVTAHRRMRVEAVAERAEALRAADAEAAYEVAKARAESVKGIADAMGTVPAALQPEFLVRAFIDGVGSRMTYNVLNDKENTIPGIVGDGVMAAVAASAFHAGVSTLLSRYGSKAGSAIAKDEMEFQKLAQSTNPAEQLAYTRRLLDNAALRRVGLDTEEHIGSMNKYLKGHIDPVTGEAGFAGGPQFVAETLLHDLPRAMGKKGLGAFKNLDEIHAGINKAWGDANHGIDRLVLEMDDANRAAVGGVKTGATKVVNLANAFFALEAEAMAPRTLQAGGPEAAKAIRTATVRFFQTQGVLDREAMGRMGKTMAALSDPELISNTELRVFLRGGWESEVMSYAGLKNTANQMRLLSFAGDFDPTLRGSKQIFAKFRGTVEETLERDMDAMFRGRGEKYEYLKRNWQAWNYINEATEKKLLQQQVARVGSAEAVSVLGRAAVTGYTAMFHPVTAAAATAGFIAPRLASTNMFQNAWLSVLQKINGGIHIDNKRLAMAAAKEKSFSDFLNADLSKIPQGKTKVVPTSDVWESVLAVRALTQNPQAAMNALTQTAQSAGAIGPELAAESVTRTQKALAMLGAALPRALKSDQWGQPDEEHLRVDPFELKRWQNVFSGITDPASVFDDLKMGDLPADKINAMWELYPEMMEAAATALQQKHNKKSKTTVKGAKVPLNLGQMKQPKFHYEKAAAVKGLMGPHASNVGIGMDKDHFQGAQDSYKTMEPQQQGGGGGGAMGGGPPSRMAAYQAPFGQATGMATDTQVTSRRA